MSTKSFPLVQSGSRARARSRRTRSTHAGRGLDDDGFQCKHCHAYVSSFSALSGVQNRNHCPYCLWSRHLDLHEAGDRLAACKAAMRPIGLTVKATNKKYGPGRGELMLIHLCDECEHLSINRIAADDVPEAVLSVFEASLQLDGSLQTRLDANGIRALAAGDRGTVQGQLFGNRNGLVEQLFQWEVFETE